MSYLDTKITKNIGNDHVQVEVSSKKAPTVRYKVPKDKADQFCKDYEPFVKKADFWSNTALALSMVLGFTLGSGLTKKMKPLVSALIGTAGAVIAGAGCGFIMVPRMENKHNEFLKKYGIETAHEKKQSMSDIIKK